MKAEFNKENHRGLVIELGKSYMNYEGKTFTVKEVCGEGFMAYADDGDCVGITKNGLYVNIDLDDQESLDDSAPVLSYSLYKLVEDVDVASYDDNNNTDVTKTWQPPVDKPVHGGFTRDELLVIAATQKTRHD